MSEGADAQQVHDPKLMTPEDQIRRSRNYDELTTETEPSAVLPIRREDSASTMIRCLLGDSQESKMSPISQVPETPVSKSLSSAKDSEHETTLSYGSESSQQSDESQSSQRAQPDESQSSQQPDESQSSQQQDESQSSQQPDESQSSQQPDESQSSQEPDDSPPLENSSSSRSRMQAREVRDVSSTETIEHDEYVADFIQQSRNRVLMFSRKQTPRLWRHKLDARVSLCLTSAVDDGVRLAQTGIVWTIDNRDVEVVFIATLGWKDGGKLGNKRSHKVVPSGSFCVFVRNAALVGCILHFQQLQRIHVKEFFMFGTPHASINKTNIAREIALTTSFLATCDPNVAEWQHVKLIKCGPKRVQPKQVQQPPIKRSRRILELEKKQLELEKKQHDEDMERKRMQEKERRIREQKRAEIEAKKKAAQAKKEEEQRRQREMKKVEEAQRRAVRLERQRRRRLIISEVKTAVSSQVARMEKKFFKYMEQLEKKLTQKVETVAENINDVVEGLGSRLEDLSEEVEGLGSSIQELEKSKRACTKRMKKLAASLADCKEKHKTLREDYKQLLTRLAKEKEVTDRFNKQCTNENARLAKEVKKLSRRKRKRAVENITPPPATRTVSPVPPQPAQMVQWSVSGQPPTSFVNNGSQQEPRRFVRRDTPRPANVGQRQPQQYVSPIFASRNLLR